jgi:predicted MPP superfamily phosphohydrolase
MAERALSWLHFSDLHASTKESFGRGRVLAALWDDLKGQMDSGLAPDFVLFSGDIADSGEGDQYKIAAEKFFLPLVEVTGVDLSRILVVPGNHDCDWDLSRRLRYPGATDFDSEIIDTLSDPDLRRMYLAPMAAYEEFRSRLHGGPGGDAAATPASPHRFEIRGLRLGVVCLNSSWLSGPLVNKPTRTGSADQAGEIAIGECQLTNGLAALGDTDLAIALVHHPLDWLHPSDQRAIETVLSKHFRFLFCGHLHGSRVGVNMSAGGGFIHIQAGCLYETRTYPNAYSVGHYSVDTGEVVLSLRRYERQADEWQRDLASTGDQGDGKVRFRVGGLPGTAAPPDEDDSSPPPGETLTGMTNASNRLESYHITFTQNCLASLGKLGMSQEELVELVQGEFRTHMNYFRFDLEGYPLPVKSQLIVYLDKAGGSVSFRDVVPCTGDLAMLAAWNDILGLYRRATRLRYRQEPRFLLQLPSHAGRAVELHVEISERMEKYFEVFVGMHVDPSVATSLDARQSPGNTAEPDASSRAFTEDERRVAFYLLEADRARQGVRSIWRSFRTGDMGADVAVDEAVMGLERSLQYLHKVIIEHSPRATG